MGCFARLAPFAIAKQWNVIMRRNITYSSDELKCQAIHKMTMKENEKEIITFSFFLFCCAIFSLHFFLTCVRFALLYVRHQKHRQQS